MTGHLCRPTRRRLADTLLAALAPVAACSLALAGRTTWAGSGNAGSPARIDVTSSALDGDITLSRHRITGPGEGVP